jgi:hypothetical protein
MGLSYPERQRLFEHQRAAITDALAIQERDMAPDDTASDLKQRDRLAHLHFDTHTGQ